MKIFTKTLIAGVITIGCTNVAQAERVILSSNFPHYWEFDSSTTENPMHNWWCGHTALKMVTKFKTGNTVSLQNIHKVFKANSPGGYAKNRCANQGQNGSWCASLYNIMTAAQLNYSMPNSRNNPVNKIVNGQQNYIGVFNTIKNIVKTGSPVIAIGAYQPNWNIGHAWVIIGYNDNGNPGAPGDAYLFLRDNSQQYPTSTEMDDWITVKDFVNMMNAQSAYTGVSHNPYSYYEFISF